MRRDSQLAIEISAALAALDTNVSPRRLEGWDLDGLGADGGLTFDEQVAHYRQLAKLAGPGKGRNADVAALRLAAHGFVCRRLRAALLRRGYIAETSEPETPLDLSTDEASDLAFERLDEVARAMSASIDQIPMPTRLIAEKVRRNVYDMAARTGEPGDVAFRSAIVNFLCLLLGGEIYDAQAIAAVAGVDPADVGPEAADLINEQLPITMWEIDETYRIERLDRVVVMARWLREHADQAISTLGLATATESQLDELATLLAPYVLYILRLIVTRFDGAEQLVSELDLPAALGIGLFVAPAFGVGEPIAPLAVSGSSARFR